LGLDKIFYCLWTGIEPRILNFQESIQQFNQYYKERVISRLEEAKQISPVIKSTLEKSEFIINGEIIPNVYPKLIKLFSMEDNHPLYPKFLIPFFHRDLNPENILVRTYPRGDSQPGDLVLIDCSGDSFDKMGNRSFQELAVEFGKLCFGFGGYNSIIYDDFQLIENKLDSSGVGYQLHFGNHTNIPLVEKIIHFIENHRIYLEEIRRLEPNFIRRIKFLMIISFLADLKYRITESSKLANLLQASVLSHKMNIF